MLHQSVNVCCTDPCLPLHNLVISIFHPELPGGVTISMLLVRNMSLCIQTHDDSVVADHSLISASPDVIVSYARVVVMN